MIAVPVFDHLIRLTGEHGLFEHALYDEPRVSAGYTTDDNARALVVAARASGTDLPSAALDRYLNFVLSAEVPGGWHNRMTQSGEWADQRGPDDTHGRAIWGLGEVASSGVEDVAILDVRGRSEFDAGHLDGVIHIPLAELTDRLAEIPDVDRLVVYCQSGSRSAIAASLLATHGVPHPLNLAGGIQRWRTEGYPVAAAGPNFAASEFRISNLE